MKDFKFYRLMYVTAKRPARWQRKDGRTRTDDRFRVVVVTSVFFIFCFAPLSAVHRAGDGEGKAHAYRLALLMLSQYTQRCTTRNANFQPMKRAERIALHCTRDPKDARQQTQHTPPLTASHALLCASSLVQAESIRMNASVTCHVPAIHVCFRFAL